MQSSARAGNTPAGAASAARVKPLKEFQSDPIYAGDLHRADMAWSKHAAGCGLTFANRSRMSCSTAAISARKVVANARWNTPSGPPGKLSSSSALKYRDKTVAR